MNVVTGWAIARESTGVMDAAQIQTLRKRLKRAVNMDAVIKWLEHYEPLWLLIVLVAELIYSIRIYQMAKIEFEYDREWNERKAARRKRQLHFDNLNSGEGK